jgi:hypothetical protein
MDSERHKRTDGGHRRADGDTEGRRGSHVVSELALLVRGTETTRQREDTRGRTGDT